MKCSHDFLVMVTLNGHDHGVYSKRNGEFISNDDKRRKEHLLKTRMHFVKGPPTMWVANCEIDLGRYAILFLSYWCAHSKVQYSTIQYIYCIYATWYNDMLYDTICNRLKCVPFSPHTGISAGINALRSVKAFVKVKLENLTWVLTLAHGRLDILIKLYHFLIYQGYLRSAKVLIILKLENLTWVLDGFHGLGWLEKKLMWWRTNE